MGNDGTRKRHPTSVEVEGTGNFDLGRAIIGMRYDCVADVIEGMLAGIREEMVDDDRRGYRQLVALEGKAFKLTLALLAVFRRIFRLCRPYMTDELEK
ncbi:MAG: hypothetical protein HGA31_04895 [Candidatus Moranbacteria bacterium]|nr:hypothetical protein [Candidatus Moranbacteria bacterium]